MLQGRIFAQQRESYGILHSQEELRARVSGRFRNGARSPLDYPAVGDDVLFDHPADGACIIHELLPRRSCIVRKAAGTAASEQVIAANVDYLLVVTGLDGDFNVRRVERYVALAATSGVAPVLVLNKADLCPNLDAKLLELAEANMTMPIHVLSATSREGVDSLQPYLDPGTTIALAGSSGAGKSTITNALLGHTAQATGSVRSGDERGRHTTTSRQMFRLPGGAFVIDTPGMRELHLWATADAVDEAFGDIEALANACRFSDCSHDREPGCAIRAALGTTLDEARFANYQKLVREQAYLERKIDPNAAAQERERWKAIHRDAEQHMAFKRRQRPK